MKRVFADTSFWVALTNRKDDLHEKALETQLALGECRLVTSVGVLTELLAFFSDSGALRANAGRMARELLDDAAIAVIPPSTGLFREALERYRARPDKSYSLTDCESMCIMEREGISEALTHDQHFAQEGYTALLR